MIRTTVVTIAVLSLVFVAGAATAQSQDFEIPGARIIAEGRLGPIGPGPSVPVDDVSIDTDPVPFRLSAGDTTSVTSCTIDDSLVNEFTDSDTVPCRVTREYSLVEPCEGAVEVAGSAPAVGGTAVDTLFGATTTADDTIQGNLDGYAWGGKTTRFARTCDADVEALEGSILQRPSEVIVVLDVEVPVCPGFGIPTCTAVSQRQAEDEVFEGTSLPIAAQSCNVTDMKADCGNVNVTGDPVNVLAATHDSVDTLRPQAIVTVDTENHLERPTPSFTPLILEGSTGAAACTVGGIPADPGVLPGAWGAVLTAEPNGELPAGTHETLLTGLHLAFGAFNENAAMLSALTSGTILNAIATVDETWESPAFHDTLHPQHDGNAGNTGCGDAVTPTASVEETPEVQGLPDTEDALEGDE